MTEPLPIFDGHNDFLLRLHRDPGTRDAIWLTGNGHGHLDLPRMKQGHFAGGFFAIYIPSPQAHDAPDYQAMMKNPPYHLPLPDMIDLAEAQSVALSMAGHLAWMERSAAGAFKVCTRVAELRDCLDRGIVSAILHMEGAEAIGPDLDALYTYHAMGLRSLGPVWSRPTVFGHGVPFAFPSSPDTGDGLTPAGQELVRACNRLGIMLDVSHLNEKGFNDIARLSDAPIVATHCNAHAVSASSRNLTDRQLSVIRDSGGMVGLNFAAGFLRPDGRKSGDMTWDPILRHLDHLIAHLGEDHVGFGSDFDGATLPDPIGDVTGLPGLQAVLVDHGYDGALMKKLCYQNWFAVLDRTWKA